MSGWETARDRERRVTALHGKGLSDRKIGLEIGIGQRTVQTIRRRLALPPNHESRGGPHSRFDCRETKAQEAYRKKMYGRLRYDRAGYTRQAPAGLAAE
jgi:transposase